MKDPSPAPASPEADDPRFICSAILTGSLPDENGLIEIDRLKLGRIAQDIVCGRPVCAEEQRAYDWLAANGGGYVIATSSRLYCEHLDDVIREHGGSIVTERSTWRDGRHTVTRTVQRFPAPTRRPCSRVVSRSRERRATPARRTSSSSRTAGVDPGSADSDPHKRLAAPHRLAPPRAVLSFGCLSAAERGEATR